MLNVVTYWCSYVIDVVVAGKGGAVMPTILLLCKCMCLDHVHDNRNK